MHSTDNLNDGYFGSGVLLWKSIKKHGREKHSKEILEFLPSRAELKSRERMLVNEEIINDPLCLNLRLGGEGGGGWNHLQPETVRANAIRNSPFGRPGFRTQEMQTLSNAGSSKSISARWDAADASLVDGRRKAIIAAASKESSAKRSKTMQERGHSCGEKNSQFDSKWVHQNGTARKIKAAQLQQHLEAGWQRGRGKFILKKTDTVSGI